MAVHDVKRQAELPKAVAMHGVILTTAYLCLEATKTSKETLKTELKLQMKFFALFEGNRLLPLLWAGMEPSRQVVKPHKHLRLDGPMCTCAFKC